MKSIVTGFLLLAATTFVANARLINALRFQELDRKVDLVVVAMPVSTKETDERSILPHISPDIPVIGLSSEFEVSFVLKGDNSLKKLVVHHYRLANPDNPDRIMIDGPMLASFEPKESKRYLLLLRREPDGRYAPFDQVDPVETSMLKLDGAGWDKMQLNDFKEWLDAKKWLNAQAYGKPARSPEIPPGGRGEGSLHEAAMNGKLEKAKALIETRPDLVFDQTAYAKQAPLHLAAEYGHKAIAELLLANKAKIEAKAYGGWTPLLNAVFGGHKDMVELLVANKADVNIKEDAGRTPLIVAAENGYTEIAAFLLTNKADVNATNSDGFTPLHTAAALGHKEFVALLLGNKAEINAKDNKGRTPLAIAVLNKHQEVAGLLRQRGGVE